MKKLARVVAIIASLEITGMGIAAAQSHHTIKSSPAKFLIDPTKPYVYLDVDHVGPRKPMREGEPNIGIWLRFHDSCIVPITVYTFGAGDPPRAFTPPMHGKEEEVGVYDNVVANPSAFDSMGVSPLPLPGYPTAPDVAAELWDTPHSKAALGTAASSPRKPEDSKMPSGYWLDVGSLTTIYPGQSIYFSLPRNHVSPNWHVEIPFQFDLNVRSPIQSAHNYVVLYEDEVVAKAVGAKSP